ncbi:MAG: hypothetical protein IKK83_01370 [Clostridia bacterium]|nr:hypothetical protein [Clostridia bacterium]
MSYIKVISLLLICTLALGLCACGGEEGTVSGVSQSEQGSETEISHSLSEDASEESKSAESVSGGESTEEESDSASAEDSVDLDSSADESGEQVSDVPTREEGSEYSEPENKGEDDSEEKVYGGVASSEEDSTQGGEEGVVYSTGRGVMGSDGAEGHVYSADSVNCLDNWEQIVESYGEDSLYYVLIFTDSTQYRRQVKEYNESLILSEEYDENGKLISRSFKEYSFADTVAAHRQRYEADLAMLKDFGIEGELQWISATDKRVDHPRSDNALCHYAFAAYVRGGELLEYIRKAEIGGFLFLMPEGCTANRYYWGSLWWQDEETKQMNELYGTDDWMTHAGSAAGPISQYLSYDPSF